MIAVTIASEALLAGLDENRERLAKLADPRTIRHERRRGGAARRRVHAPSTTSPARSTPRRPARRRR